ncbi:MAG: oligosaccharide flippase family protein [Elusimicrobiota bacterium]
MTNGFAAVLNIFLPISLVRILSPDQIGRYKIFFLYTTLSAALFLTAGFSNGLYHWMGNYPQTKPQIRQSWTWCLALVMFFSLSGLIFAEPLARYFQFSVIDFNIFMLVTPFAIAAGFFEDLMIARGDIWRGSWYSSGFNLVRTSAIFAAAWWTREIEFVLWAYVGVSLLKSLSGWLILSKTGELTPLFSMKESRDVFRYAVPVSLAALAGIGLTNIDQMILSFRLSPAEFAFYAMGCLSIPPLDILETSVNRILIPRMARASGEGDQQKVARLFAQAVGELWLFLLPAAVGLILFSKPIVLILFTEKYAAAANYLQFFALAYLFMAIPFNSLARARADGAWILKTTLLSAPISLLAVFLSASRWGAMGALLSMLSTTLGLRLYALTYARRCLNLPYSSFLPFRDLLTQLGAALVASGISLGLRPFFHDSRMWFFVAGPIFPMIYFCLTYAIFLKRFKARSLERPHILQLAVRLGHDRQFEAAMVDLCRLLTRDNRFRVSVGSYGTPAGHSPPPTLCAQSDIPLIIWNKSPGFSTPTLFRIMRLVFNDQVSIIHAHDVGPLVYGSLVKLMTLGQVRLILSVHSVRGRHHSPQRRFFYRMFSRFPDHVLADSEETRTDLRELGVESKLVGKGADARAVSYYELF